VAHGRDLHRRFGWYGGLRRREFPLRLERLIPRNLSALARRTRELEGVP
jgi:hypothetical protein